MAELGPGSSQGVGLAALIAGAERYFALDLIDFSDVEQNLRVFDELVEMFRQRAAIPSAGVHSLRYPDLEDYSFPAFLALPGFEGGWRRSGKTSRRGAGGSCGWGHPGTMRR